MQQSRVQRHRQDLAPGTGHISFLGALGGTDRAGRVGRKRLDPQRVWRLVPKQANDDAEPHLVLG